MSFTNTAILTVLALLGALTITCGVTIIVFVEVYLTHWGTYSTTEHSIYIVALTITSTLLASFITNQIRKLLLMQVDHKLTNFTGPESQNFEYLNRRWQTILGIESLFIKVGHPQIAIIYLATGLITTALVASFSPSTTIRQYPFLSVLPLGPNRCVAGWLPSKPAKVAYWWPPLPGFDDGYFIYAALDDCPTRDAMTLMGNININNPSVFAYADKDVAVHPTAVDTPLSIYSSEGSSSSPDEGLHVLVQRYGSSVVNTTQCVPVMVKNPISCHKGGSILTVGSESATVFSDDGMCNWTAHFDVSNPFDNEEGGAMDDIMCTHGSVGQGTIVIGAFWHYAQYLALTMGDYNWVPDQDDSTYTVTCSADATNIFDYRTVTFSQQSSSIITESGYAKSLVGGASCTPDTPTIGLVQIATAAAANWAPLKEGQELDGLFDSILQVAVQNITDTLSSGASLGIQ